MACMCGDLMCRSCGPAQGNYRCSACGAWSSDGGCKDRKKCEAVRIQEAEAEYQALLQAEKDAAEFWASHPEES